MCVTNLPRNNKVNSTMMRVDVTRIWRFSFSNSKCMLRANAMAPRRPEKHVSNSKCMLKMDAVTRHRPEKRRHHILKLYMCVDHMIRANVINVLWAWKTWIASWYLGIDNETNICTLELILFVQNKGNDLKYIKFAKCPHHINLVLITYVT